MEMTDGTERERLFTDLQRVENTAGRGGKEETVTEDASPT